MTKTLVAVFAHPDDEVFGPGGSLAYFSKKYNVYLVCATDGNLAGRKEELLGSAKILGVKKVDFLNFTDGGLCNNNYHRLAQAIERKLRFYRPETVLTFETKGVSGHLDHVAVSLTTTFAVKKLKFVKKILYFCELKSTMKLMMKNFGGYFVYMPPGYSRKEVNLIINTQDYWQTRLKAMACHRSQRSDARKIIKTLDGLPKKEHFLVSANRR